MQGASQSTPPIFPEGVWKTIYGFLETDKANTLVRMKRVNMFFNENINKYLNHLNNVTRVMASQHSASSCTERFLKLLADSRCKAPFIVWRLAQLPESTPGYNEKLQGALGSEIWAELVKENEKQNNSN